MVKNKLVGDKQLLKEKLAAVEADNGNGFEPAKRFVKASKHARSLTTGGTDTEKRDFLKKHGSNLTISARHPPSSHENRGNSL
jgi:hypothetical protein